MILKTQKKWKVYAWKSGSSLIFLMSLTFAFQNCGKAGFDSQDASYSDNVSSSVDPKLAGLPFPYEVSVNQIAFMSCPFPVATPAAIESAGYFTWKVGAFENTAAYPSSLLGISSAGLRLNPKFKSEFKKIANQNQYNSAIVPVKFKEALTTLPSVVGSQLQLSIRNYSNPQTGLAQMPTSGSYVPGLFPPINFMSPLSSEVIANSFDYNNSTGLYHFFPLATSNAEASLEASLSIPATMSYYSFLQQSFNSNYLTVGFSQPQSNNGEAIAGPPENTNLAYARGFSPTFGLAYSGLSHPPVDGLYPPLILSGLTERDLSGTIPGETAWNCSGTKFKIVKATDRYTKIYAANNFVLPDGDCPGEVGSGEYCPTPSSYQVSSARLFGRSRFEFPNGICPEARYYSGASPSTHAFTGEFCVENYTYACPYEPFSRLTPENKAVYYALRRFLPENIWDINVSQGCIVNKLETGGTSTCYDTSTSAKIVYDESFFDNLNANASLGAYRSCASGGICPAYLTLCYK